MGSTRNVEEISALTEKSLNEFLELHALDDLPKEHLFAIVEHAVFMARMKGLNQAKEVLAAM